MLNLRFFLCGALFLFGGMFFAAPSPASAQASSSITSFVLPTSPEFFWEVCRQVGEAMLASGRAVTAISEEITKLESSLETVRAEIPLRYRDIFLLDRYTYDAYGSSSPEAQVLRDELSALQELEKSILHSIEQKKQELRKAIAEYREMIVLYQSC
ncbi:MAG: hypothetical protein KDD70_12725 [Bdellovibrionales bacterium]|nr:hypothetical protein [Bdellovibrionales bacterium]